MKIKNGTHLDELDVCQVSIIYCLGNAFQLHPSLLRSRMLKCSQDDGFGSLSSMHAPKRPNLVMVFYHPYKVSLG